MKNTLTDRIRERFPSPRNFRGVAEQHPGRKIGGEPNDPNEIGYCVGGAFIMWVDGQIPFPAEGQITEQLMKTNRHLSSERAERYATRITRLNDWDRFEEAWQTLDDALAYQEQDLPEYVPHPADSLG